MDFLPGFAWPVPRAFASAVSVCRFEQGDVFFDAADAYEEWRRGRKRKVRFHVQVLDPPRSARSAPVDAESNRFAANWASPVTCEVGDRKARTTEVVRSTQGRLFTCLWRGDRALLQDVEPGTPEDLPLPAVGRGLQKHLAASLGAFLEASGRPAGAGTWFLSVVDASSEASLAKARSIESVLAASPAGETYDLSPQEAGVPHGDTYHPALRVRGFWVADEDADVVRERLKHALYGPAKSGPDRFKLERHGLLVGPGEVATGESG